MASTVAEIMDSDFFYASQGDSIGQLLHDMAKLGLGSAPVLDLEGHPLGMATTREIDGCRRMAELPEHLQQPVVSVHRDTPIDVAARRLAESDADCLVLVDDRGVAVGALRALDLLRAVLGLRGRPGNGERAGRDTHSWSRGVRLDIESAHHAPSAPGIILLDPGRSGDKPHIVWAESTPDIRQRLDEMLCMPQSDPALEQLLDEQPRRLLFRALVVTDDERRGRMVRALQGVLARRKPELAPVSESD
jgi:CBS domain-containing protein